MPETAIVYAKNTTLREGLAALLDSLPQIKKVIEGVEFISVLEEISQSNSTLLLIDASLFNRTERGVRDHHELITALQTIKRVTPSVASLVLVDNIDQLQALEGEPCVDGVILKGFHAVDFFEVIEETLQRKKKVSRKSS